MQEITYFKLLKNNIYFYSTGFEYIYMQSF